MNEKNKPVKKFVVGTISATIWENIKTKTENNKTINYSIYSINIEKSYKKDNEWKKTNSFNVEDLPKINLVTFEAYKYLTLMVLDNE